MKSEYGIWKKVACQACTVAVAGVCAAHALLTQSEQHQPIQFYQSGEHPERQPVPQPQQQQITVLSSSSSALSSGLSSMPFISGDPAAGDFSLTWRKPDNSTVTLYVTGWTDTTSKSA